MSRSPQAGQSPDNIRNGYLDARPCQLERRTAPRLRSIRAGTAFSPRNRIFTPENPHSVTPAHLPSKSLKVSQTTLQAEDRRQKFKRYSSSVHQSIGQRVTSVLTARHPFLFRDVFALFRDPRERRTQVIARARFVGSSASRYRQISPPSRAR